MVILEIRLTGIKKACLIGFMMIQRNQLILEEIVISAAATAILFHLETSIQRVSEIYESPFPVVSIFSPADPFVK